MHAAVFGTELVLMGLTILWVICSLIDYAMYSSLFNDLEQKIKVIEKEIEEGSRERYFDKEVRQGRIRENREKQAGYSQERQRSILFAVNGTAFLIGLVFLTTQEDYLMNEFVHTPLARFLANAVICGAGGLFVSLCVAGSVRLFRNAADHWYAFQVARRKDVQDSIQNEAVLSKIRASVLESQTALQITEQKVKKYAESEG